ncbi:MAG: hypothetical protein IPI51_15710 [Betaproteobacteria bacterium]|nr:hypothetical protein [Betaproteobacteria bacterium]
MLVDGRSARLGARAFDLLLALVRQRERLVPRGELFQARLAGPRGRGPEPQGQVVALRKLLGEAIIQTVPGRDYRFAAEVDDGGTTTIARRPRRPCRRVRRHRPTSARHSARCSGAKAISRRCTACWRANVW